MNKTSLCLALLVYGIGITASGQSTAQPNKVGVIDIQRAIASTQEGQKAGADLAVRYEPKRKELEKKQAEIQGLRDQLSRGSNTMSDEARKNLTLDIDQRTKVWNRETEDAQADFQQDQDKVLQGFFERMQVVIDKYARDSGYALILDISAQQSPVLYAASGSDITTDIVALYDKNSPAPAAAKPPAAAPAAAKPPVAAPPAKPVAPAKN